MSGWVDEHFDIFLTFYLNHLSPLQGYFSFSARFLIVPANF